MLNGIKSSFEIFKYAQVYKWTWTQPVVNDEFKTTLNILINSRNFVVAVVVEITSS